MVIVGLAIPSKSNWWGGGCNLAALEVEILGIDLTSPN